jgi:hypothetical protein
VNLTKKGVNLKISKKNLGNFGEMCFSSVISTNLAISGGDFAKILTSLI